MELKTTFSIYGNDKAPYFGAYVMGSLNNNEPVLMLNIDAVIQVVQQEENKVEAFRDIILQGITHEFCHAMQEWLGKEYNELEVEKILGAYNEKWNVFNAEPPDYDEGPVFSIEEFLTELDGLTLDPGATQDQLIGADKLKGKVRDLFLPHYNWHKAEKENRLQQLKQTLSDENTSILEG